MWNVVQCGYFTIHTNYSWRHRFREIDGGEEQGKRKTESKNNFHNSKQFSHKTDFNWLHIFDLALLAIWLEIDFKVFALPNTVLKIEMISRRCWTWIEFNRYIKTETTQIDKFREYESWSGKYRFDDDERIRNCTFYIKCSFLLVAILKTTRTCRTSKYQICVKHCTYMWVQCNKWTFIIASEIFIYNFTSTCMFNALHAIFIISLHDILLMFHVIIVVIESDDVAIARQLSCVKLIRICLQDTSWMEKVQKSGYDIVW